MTLSIILQTLNNSFTWAKACNNRAFLKARTLIILFKKGTISSSNFADCTFGVLFNLITWPATEQSAFVRLQLIDPWLLN